MGLFSSMKDAMSQAQAGMGSPAATMTARNAIQDQAREHNRIRATGLAGTALIRGHVDTGEQAAGNPVWLFDVEVTPDGGAPYAVQHREIVSAMAIGGYADGTSIACHIDPADQTKIAFG